ncbi:MAG: MATE family efflux transporter [Treponema sp.]|nr:MATE family efflux transporter [Treponema sp.]
MNDINDFTTGSISKKMIRFMVPILAALVLQAMYGAVDLLIVGKFGTTAGISGVTTGSSIMNLFTFTIAALTTAVTVVMGRYLGEKNYSNISKLLGSAVSFFFVVGVALSFVIVCFARPIVTLLQTPPEAVDLTVQYIRICGLGYIFVVFYNVISCIFRGFGDSTSPLIFVLIACVVNIVGDLLLVAVLHMNAAGAAIATIVAQAVSVLLSLIIIKRKKLPFTITKNDVCFSVEVPKFLVIGAPLALQDLLTNVTFLALCAFVNRLGLEASSGYGVAQKVQSFVMLIPVAIMQSMASFVAQNVGANKEDRARKVMLFGMGFGSAIGVVVGIAVFCFGDGISTLFTNDPAVVARSFEFLRGFAAEAVVTCLLFSFMGYFNGHARSLFVMLQSLAQSFLVRLPVSYIMSIKPDASLTGVGLAAPLATCFGILLCFIYYRKLQKGFITQ